MIPGAYRDFHRAGLMYRDDEPDPVAFDSLPLGHRLAIDQDPVHPLDPEGVPPNAVKGGLVTLFRTVIADPKPSAS